MSSGPACEPRIKRPRWGASETSPPAASDARSFPRGQRRVLHPKDAAVRCRVPPSSPGGVPGWAGPHRGSITSLGTWGSKDLCPSPRPQSPLGLRGDPGTPVTPSGLVCTAPRSPYWATKATGGEMGSRFSCRGVRSPDEPSRGGK